MKHGLLFGILLWLFGSATAVADPSPEETRITTLDQPMTSHDGSWFGQLDDTGLGLSADPVVTAGDGTVQSGTFTRLTDEDLDAVSPSLVLWKPDEPLPAGTYTVSFESQSGTLDVDPTLELALTFGEATVSSEYLTTPTGEGSAGTTCCSIDGVACEDGGCVDCWATYKFLNARATLAIPAFPNSLAVRTDAGRGSRVVLISGTEVTVYSGFEQEQLCIELEVLDAALAAIQSEQRCGDVDESPSDDELIREEPASAACIDEPCTRIASSVDDAMPDCPIDLGTAQPEPAAKTAAGCGCASVSEGSLGSVLIALGLLGLRRRRADSGLPG